MLRTMKVAAMARLRASCAYGIAMARLELFPFHLVRATGNHVANKQPSVDWYPGCRTRYEDMPIAADIIMSGTVTSSLTELVQNFQRQKSPIDYRLAFLARSARRGRPQHSSGPRANHSSGGLATRSTAAAITS
jgi:hypothetical protein